MKSFSHLLSKYFGVFDPDKLKSGIKVRISFEVADHLFDLNPGPTYYRVVETIHVSIKVLESGDIELFVKAKEK